MSEWGNPAASNAVTLTHKRSVELTWGSETSQYPEENRTKVIPLVAASEEGRAQTSSFLIAFGTLHTKILKYTKLRK